MYFRLVIPVKKIMVNLVNFGKDFYFEIASNCSTIENKWILFDKFFQRFLKRDLTFCKSKALTQSYMQKNSIKTVEIDPNVRALFAF